MPSLSFALSNFSTNFLQISISYVTLYSQSFVEKVWLKWFFWLCSCSFSFSCACCPRELKSTVRISFNLFLLWFVARFIRWSSFDCHTLHLANTQCEWHLVIRKPQLSQTLSLALRFSFCVQFAIVWVFQSSSHPNVRTFVNYTENFRSRTVLSRVNLCIVL